MSAQTRIPSDQKCVGPDAAGVRSADGAETTPAPDAPPKTKQPPPERPSDIRRRSYVILSFWLVVLLLGLPIWWNTTTIYRADLPLDEMMYWADGRVRFSTLPYYQTLPDGQTETPV